MAKIPVSKASERVSRLEAFISHGALSARGVAMTGDELMFGRMGEAGQAAIKPLKKINYVVHSYNTPIAVHDENEGWVVPAQKYSSTTSKHQSVTKAGINQSGRPMTEVKPN
jgi:hypothetical protein